MPITAKMMTKYCLTQCMDVPILKLGFTELRYLPNAIILSPVVMQFVICTRVLCIMIDTAHIHRYHAE